MAKVISLTDFTPTGPTERLWCYNGTDCLATLEVLDVLYPQLDNRTEPVYRFSRALQGPVLEMRLRGVRIDADARSAALDLFHDNVDRLERQLDRIVLDGVGLIGFNWRSPADLATLFYSRLRIPEVRKKGRVTVDRDALEKIEQYDIAAFIVRHLKAIKDIEAKLKVLRTAVDPDGRMRTSYNIAGTSTGRFSSSFTEFGTGGNFQNIEEALRRIFIADPKMKLAYLDAQQGESRVVGAIEGDLFQDWKYLDACEGGDLHTSVARLVWPDLAWTGELSHDRSLAERPYYRHYDRRFMCKKIGHGSNYGGRPNTLAKQAKVEIGLVQDFQPAYFSAFPAHLLWHDWTRRELAHTGTIISLTGRKRQFWGRRDSDEVFREAVAFQGQALCDIVNYGMLNVWRNRTALLMKQDHDAITVQYPEKQEDEIIPQILDQLRYPVQLGERELVIPYDVATGWNLGKWGKDNPDGLKKWSGGDKRKRSPKVSILDRGFHRSH